MSLECLGTSPILAPVPQLYHHVIRGGEDEGLSGVNRYTPEYLRVIVLYIFIVKVISIK